jgi:N-acetylglucosaminyldiphosphoundecaprenol N-acetyl-beta-D-mannosaminyltransferase
VIFRKAPFMGYQLVACTPETCVATIAEWIAEGDRARWLACLNPHSWVVAMERPEFAEALATADWLVPDGAGIMVASKLRGEGPPRRVTGSDVFEGLSRLLDGRGGARVFFLGGNEETLSAIRARYGREFPHVTVAGTFAPPFQDDFGEAQVDEMVAAVNAARADVLWIGLGAPKQELLLHRAIGRFEVRFAAAIGAVFDYYAGRVQRAHPVLRRAGLEWLPRLVQEPRRLWRRVFVSTPIFLWHVARHPHQGSDSR